MRKSPFFQSSSLFFYLLQHSVHFGWLFRSWSLLALLGAAGSFCRHGTATAALTRGERDQRLPFSFSRYTQRKQAMPAPYLPNVQVETLALPLYLRFGNICAVREREREISMDKAAFVSGLQGGEPAELVVVMSLLATGFLLHRAVCLTLRCSRGLLALLVEILCIPILLCVGFTLLEDWLIELSGLCIALSLLMLAHALPTASNGAPEYAEDKSSPWSTLTVYRGGMMLATCVSILAVDFAVYPRRFAKTEEYGFSLMDVGVGSFVFSSGLAARRPLSGRDSVWQIMRDSGIVLLLGVGRFVLTELTAYPQHVSEYGTHWNFFLTMGLISMGVRLFDATSWPHVGWAGLGLLTLHQLPTCLFPSLLEWLLNAPRDSWISHNREGLLGLPGFAHVDGNAKAALAEAGPR